MPEAFCIRPLNSAPAAPRLTAPDEIPSRPAISTVESPSTSRNTSTVCMSEGRRRKESVDQIGAHCALRRFIAPVANVLEKEQSQNDFSGRARRPRVRLLGLRLAKASYTVVRS